MNTQEQAAFDLMREALEYCKHNAGVPELVWKRASKALAAAEEVSETVGINGLTEAETSATMSVIGLSKPKKLTSYERKCFNDWKNP